MSEIKMLVFDIDGVITDGKRYVGAGEDIKTVAMKDLDAVGMLHGAGLKVGCVTGEDTAFSRTFVQMAPLDYAAVGCKEKLAALREIGERLGIAPEEICYIGDGKYDIPVLEAVGLALCPADAIAEVKQASDIVLERKGGEGCLAECYTLLARRSAQRVPEHVMPAVCVRERMEEHMDVLRRTMADERYLGAIQRAAELIVKCYEGGGRVLLCGNGGSAADAQHLAGELVGRFLMERRALDAEALSTNTSVITSIGNDYDYARIFARQVEGKVRPGDVLIGITTSGTSKNILLALQKAKERGAITILMTGDIPQAAPVLPYTDCLLAVPSRCTPRIQEMHILAGHIICEIVEKEIASKAV